MTKRWLIAIVLGMPAYVAGCRTEPDPIVEPSVTQAPSDPDASTDAEDAADGDSADAVDPEVRGLDDEPDAIPPGLEGPPDPELLESLPTIEELPALSDETPIDEAAKLPFAKVGGFRFRDGVYYLRMVADGAMRELVMTVETQANGFVVRRGERTRLRFVPDGETVAFASEPGSGQIAGRGRALGDDWARGAYRTKNEDGTTTEGVFELRKLYDPPIPRKLGAATEDESNAAPSPDGAAERPGAAAPPTAEAPED